MSFQLVKCLGLDGYSLFQQIENHFADGVDLIGVGMGQHLLTFLLIGFFQNALQEGALTS